MKIECILRRDGGTKAEIGGLEYHFAPLADGAHVAEVENEEHQDRFLSISEAYRVYRGKLEAKGGATAVDAHKPVQSWLSSKPVLSGAPIMGSDLLPPQFTIGEQTYSQLDIAKRALEKSGLTEDEWNDLGDDDRASRMEVVLDDLADDDADTPEPEETDERAALVAEYEAKFGKKPHGKASVETIKAKLAE